MKVFDRQKLRSEVKISQRLGVIHYGNLLEMVLNEMLILGELDNKNIIGFVEVIDSSFNVHEYLENTPLYMIIEFAARGESLSWQPNLNRYSRVNRKDGEPERYSEEDVRRLMKGITNGLGYCWVTSARDGRAPPGSETPKHFDRPERGSKDRGLRCVGQNYRER